VLKNRVLRRIFGPKRTEQHESGENFITRTLRIPSYYLCDKIEKNEMGMASSMNGERTGAYRVLVGKPERKRPLG